MTLLKKAPKASLRSRCCWLWCGTLTGDSFETFVGFTPFCDFSDRPNEAGAVDFGETEAIGAVMAGVFWLGQPAILDTFRLGHFQNPIIFYGYWLFCCP